MDVKTILGGISAILGLLLLGYKMGYYLGRKNGMLNGYQLGKWSAWRVIRWIDNVGYVSHANYSKWASNSMEEDEGFTAVGEDNRNGRGPNVNRALIRKKARLRHPQ